MNEKRIKSYPAVKVAVKRPFKNASTFEVKRLGVLIKMSKRFCFILKRLSFPDLSRRCLVSLAGMGDTSWDAC